MPLPLLPLFILCAAAAWALARGWPSRRRRPSYLPVARLLTLGIVSDLAREGLQRIWLRPARAMLGDAPYPWPERLAIFGERALMVAWPFAILAAAVATFLHRRAWTLVVLWALIAIADCAAYPWLRLERHRIADAILWTATLVAYVAICWRSWQLRHDVGPPHLALHLMISAELGVTAFVRWWPETTANWGLARLAYAIIYSILLCYQFWRIRYP